MSHLAACPSCGRHIRVTESACPFCQCTTTEAFRSVPAPQPAMRRLGRAAIFTLATTGAIAGGVVACSDDTTTALYGGPPVDASAGAADGQSNAVYGGPALDSGRIDGSLQPAYGGAPIDLDASDSD